MPLWNVEQGDTLMSNKSRNGVFSVWSV